MFSHRQMSTQIHFKSPGGGHWAFPDVFDHRIPSLVFQQVTYCDLPEHQNTTWGTVRNASSIPSPRPELREVLKTQWWGSRGASRAEDAAGLGARQSPTDTRPLVCTNNHFCFQEVSTLWKSMPSREAAIMLPLFCPGHISSTGQVPSERSWTQRTTRCLISSV